MSPSTYFLWAIVDLDCGYWLWLECRLCQNSENLLLLCSPPLFYFNQRIRTIMLSWKHDPCFRFCPFLVQSVFRTKEWSSNGNASEVHNQEEDCAAPQGASRQPCHALGQSWCEAAFFLVSADNHREHQALHTCISPPLNQSGSQVADFLLWFCLPMFLTLLSPFISHLSRGNG